MATYADVTNAIAARLKTALTIGSTHPVPPATLGVDSAVIIPAATWGSFDGTTFCDADVRWELVLIAPTSDYARAFVWFHDRLAEVAAAFDADPTLGGLVDGCIPMGWRQPERIAVGTQTDALAVYVELAPMRIQ